MNHAVRKRDPLLARQDRHQIRFDLDGILLGCKSQSATEPSDVRIYDNSRGNPKRGTENDVGRLSTNARQLCQLLQRLRHLAAILTGERTATGLNVARLVAKESGGLHHDFQLLDR